MHQRKRWVSKMYPISSKVIFILQINMWWILDSVLKVVFLQYTFSVKNFSELVCLRFERPHSVQLFSCRFCRKDPETFASTIEIVDNNGGVRGFSLCGYKQPRKTHDSNFCSLILLMQKGVDCLFKIFNFLLRVTVSTSTETSFFSYFAYAFSKTQVRTNEGSSLIFEVKWKPLLPGFPFRCSRRHKRQFHQTCMTKPENILSSTFLQETSLKLCGRYLFLRRKQYPTLTNEGKVDVLMA